MQNNSVVGREEQHRSILNKIEEGMTVYDREDKKVGTVERLHYGAGSAMDDTPAGEKTASVGQENVESRRDPVTDAIADALSPADQVPAEMRERLLQNGFIRIDGAGLFASDRYVMPDQISGVSEDKVALKVTKNELLKR